MPYPYGYAVCIIWRADLILDMYLLLLYTVLITGEIIHNKRKQKKIFDPKLVRLYVVKQASEIHVRSTTSRASAYGFPIFDAMFPSHFMKDQNLLIDSSK